jgi:HK97 family phage prohead protease
MSDGLSIEPVGRHYAAWEFKFAETDAADTRGLFEGHGSVFNTLDSYRDIIVPTAFDRTLGEWRGKNQLPTMYMQHEQANPFLSARPAGLWRNVETDSKGLAVRGQLIALDTEFGKLNYAQMRDGGMRGLSIAFSTPEDGAELKKGSDGKRFRELKDLDLYSIDIVAEPANPSALVSQLKAMMTMPNHQKAADSIAAAGQMCADCMGGGDAPTSGERNQIMGHLHDAHRALTGSDMPLSQKMAFHQLREFKKWLHLPVDQGGLGFSNSQADEIAQLVFKSKPRDESGDADAARVARKQIVGDLANMLSGFSLKFGE